MWYGLRSGSDGCAGGSGEDGKYEEVAGVCGDALDVPDACVKGFNREGNEGFLGKATWVLGGLCEVRPGRTPNSDGDELAPWRTGLGGCEDDRLRPKPRLLAVLAGKEEAVNRATGCACAEDDMLPEPRTAGSD